MNLESGLLFKTCFKLKNVILGVLKNETCYKTGRVSTRDFTVVLFTKRTKNCLRRRVVRWSKTAQNMST